MKHKRLVIVSLVTLMVLVMVTIICSRWYSAEYSHPQGLGLVNGGFSECGSNPNCVSSQTTQKKKYIAPLNTHDTEELAWLMLSEVVGEMPQAILITEYERYRHYQFTSPLMGFIDDVELLFDPTKKQVQVKSASRVGKSDMGANRSRVELLRERLEAAMSGDETI